MHIVVARLSARYSGRGDSLLAPYDRIVVVKNDTSVSIHGEKGFKPLNYMMSPTVKSEKIVNGEKVWVFDSRKESLEITFHEIYDEIDLNLGNDDPGLTKDGTEGHLQEWLSQHMEVISSDVKFLEREFQTGDGPIDLIGEYLDGSMAAIEVKRVAPINTVGQVVRYVDALEEKFPERKIVGVIAAIEFKTKTKVLAEKKNIICVEIPETWNNESNIISQKMIELTTPKNPFSGSLFDES